MAHIKHRKHPHRQTASLTLLAMTLPGLALAQQSAQQPVKTLPEVKVTGEAASTYKPEAVASPKYTEPLRDTPQTITVIPKEVMQDQGILSLKDALSLVPGITFGAGEGGGGATYDNITFRGMPGNDSITVDGIRDSGRVARTDNFNLEQIEVSNGANSAVAGASAVGGSINLVSKVARSGNFGNVSAGLGTDDYRRLTADINRELAEGVAARLNLMVHGNDIPGRDYEDAKRWGIAPSITFGLNTPTRFSLSYLHQKDELIPQYGVPFYNGRSVPGVDRENYYGYHNVDTQEITTDTVTGLFEHAFNDKVSLRNQTRYSKVDQFSIVNPPQGTWCLASTGRTPTGAACTASVTGPSSSIAVPPGFYLPSGPRGTTRDISNTIISNQTDLTTSFATGFVEHTLVTGLSFSRETYELTNGNSQSVASFPNPLNGRFYPFMSISDPDSYYGGAVNFNETGYSEATVNNAAIYAFDTLKFNPQWQASAAVRYEKNKGEFRSDTLASGVTTTRGATLENDDNLFSWRLALTYKPVPIGAIYVAYGNAKTPSQSSVNGGCSNTVTSGTGTGGATCNLEPETSKLMEVGTKWDLFDNRLALTASVFRNERTNYKVASGDPLVPEQQLDGQSRVDGIALGLAGSITDNWSVFANYTYLDSEVLQGASNHAASLGQDYTKGDKLGNTPDHAFSLWTTYRLPFGLRVGYGVQYQGEMYLNSSSATAKQSLKTDDYWVHRAMIGYQFDKHLDFQLNINNLTDEEYYTRIRNNGWAVPGDGRSVVLSAVYSF